MLVLDMDGVLVNFCKAAYKTHNQPFSNEVPTKFDFFEDWGMTSKKFWSPIDACGPEWWTNLEKYPWTDTLISLADQLPGGMLIATSCSSNSNSAAGKVRAIQSLFGYNFWDYLLAPRKWHLSQPGYVLLDDYEVNCDKWEERGGKAILFPQPWNRNRWLATEELRMEWVLEQIAESMYEDV